ncbi:hypothetical protein DH2020_012019 [Rehmannia glutinosa]|uniref:ACT domain-containing protein ACR n=1 Tax=Rehmannia glutinosa TaxID=99300 RepID=A0ABR0XFN4_REHGL
MDDEYEKLIRRMNPPRYIFISVIPLFSCFDLTISLIYLQLPIARVVDSANKQGILLEVVQILTDLNLMITKAYICSDGGWFMDVTRSRFLLCIFDEKIRRVTSGVDHTSIELIGSDRPGLLSEVSAVLTHLKCNVVSAEVWTHNTRAAAVMQVTDEETGGAISDPERLTMVKRLLCNVLKGSNKSREAKTAVSCGATHTDRRLHQMMFDDRDYERMDDDSSDEKERPSVNVVNWHDKDYSVVTIRCKDRPKLLFDIVCTLTDMQYVVFHGNVEAEGTEAYQEYCIRHIDGSPVKSDAERQRVIQCLEAAIQRRVSEVNDPVRKVKYELVTKSLKIICWKLLVHMSRSVFLTVTRAEVSTRAGKAVNTFYVRDASGYPVDPKIIDSIRQTIGQTILRVKGSPQESQVTQESPTSEFPGFQTIATRDERVVNHRRPPLSRLQRRAPRPLQLKSATSDECRSSIKLNKDQSSSASAFSSKDPIPLLSPLVLPSMLDSPVIQQEKMAKSH